MQYSLAQMLHSSVRILSNFRGSGCNIKLAAIGLVELSFVQVVHDQESSDVNWMLKFSVLKHQAAFASQAKIFCVNIRKYS